MCTSGTICCTSESSAVESALDGNRRQVELTAYDGAAVGSTTSMRFSPTCAAFTRYWNDKGACSKVTSTAAVVLLGLGTL
jgi:hypothetical protein